MTDTLREAAQAVVDANEAWAKDQTDQTNMLAAMAADEAIDALRAALATPAPPRIDPERLAAAIRKCVLGGHWIDLADDLDLERVDEDAAAIAKAYEEDVT